MTFIELVKKSKERYSVTSESVIYSVIFKLSKKVKNKTEFLLEGKSTIDFSEKTYFRKLDEYYIDHKPLGLIVGETKFMGLKLKVFKGILVPRNETEIVATKAAELIEDYLSSKNIKEFSICDLCCGTGCIGLGIYKYLGGADITCVDINPVAIENTKYNAKINKCDIETICGDFYDSIKQKVNCIVCNPPYVNEKDLDKNMLKYENKISFTNSNDDLYFYEKLISNYKKTMKRNFLMVFEIGYDQKPGLQKLLKKNNLDKISKFYKDYNGKNRMLIISRLQKLI
ncbi:MAG: class I SAM-dependent methyltransferase [Mycoplasmataceae bacterium]|jgi:release factor glutamine methyltransferase|nr:class I SAM-dependent methyltransferase [Mycoplasmataceae bacterium]